MNQEQVTITVRALKGAPASIVLAMLLMPRKVSVGVMDLITLTGYGKDAVRHGLETLQAMGMAQKLGRYKSWVLTSKAYQLVLGDGEGVKNALPLSDNETNSQPVSQDREGVEIALPTTTDITTSSDAHYDHCREGAKNVLPLSDSKAISQPPSQNSETESVKAPSLQPDYETAPQPISQDREGAEIALPTMANITTSSNNHQDHQHEDAKNAHPSLDSDIMLQFISQDHHQESAVSASGDRYATSVPTFNHREGAKNALPPQKSATDDFEGEISALPETCTCCISNHHDHHLTKKLTNTTTCDLESEKNALPQPEIVSQATATAPKSPLLPPEWSDVVETMVQRCGTPRQYAHAAIQAARERDEIPPYVTWNILRWLEYCVDPQWGNGINNPAIFIARKIENGDLCPEKFEVPYHSEIGREIYSLQREWKNILHPEPEFDSTCEGVDISDTPFIDTGTELPETIQIWQKALAELEHQMTRATFNTWLRDTQVIGVENADTLVVGVKNNYAVDWLENRLITPIQRTMHHITDTEWRFRFVVFEPIQPSMHMQYIG